MTPDSATPAPDPSASALAGLELRRLAAEQAALRRVATRVAAGAAPEEVFQLATEEVCGVLELRSALLLRFEDDRSALIVGKFGEPADDFLLGARLELDAGAARHVLESGRPARVVYRELPGQIAERMLATGFTASVAVPIVLAGATWGALIAGLRDDEALECETEERLQAFAELVGLALASAHARAELAASRLRIVEASDAERRRIERNLHDGAQQRLVALAVRLRLARTRAQQDPAAAEELLAGAERELAEALAELRELAQGIHPPLLEERGLAPALAALALRSPLPVELELDLDCRLPVPVETAAYYLVSEALANATKHASATRAVVRVVRADAEAIVEIGDDGVGGARVGAGTGLSGLRDRVAALDGTLELDSPDGCGTRVRCALPLRGY